MGNVVNESSNLCHQGHKGIRKAIQVSTDVYGNLNSQNKGLLSPVYGSLGLQPSQYEGDIINTAMDNWLTEQKQKATNTTALASGLLGQGLTIPRTRTWI